MRHTVTRELFVLLVRIPVKAGFENEYLSLINAVIDEMRHETSFVNAVVHRSTEDPTVFLLHETWLGRDEFFTVQMKRSYRESYEARLPGIMRFWTGLPRSVRSSSSTMRVSRVRPVKCRRPFQAWRRMRKRSSVVSG